MSQYQPINDERAPFMGTDKTSAFDIGDEEEQAVSGTTLSYPPAPAYTGKAILTYTYRTEWDQPHNAMGVLGRSKDETIDIVREIFPQISDCARDRFKFWVQLDGQEWVEISDGVWPEVIATQPKRFIVRVKDLPGMARRRVIRVLLIISAVLGSLVGIGLLMTYLSSDKEWIEVPEVDGQPT